MSRSLIDIDTGCGGVAVIGGSGRRGLERQALTHDCRNRRRGGCFEARSGAVNAATEGTNCVRGRGTAASGPKASAIMMAESVAALVLLLVPFRQWRSLGAVDSPFIGASYYAGVSICHGSRHTQHSRESAWGSHHSQCCPHPGHCGALHSRAIQVRCETVSHARQRVSATLGCFGTLA